MSKIYPDLWEPCYHAEEVNKKLSIVNNTSSEAGFELVNDMSSFTIRCWNRELLLKRRFLLHDKNMKLFAGFLSVPSGAPMPLSQLLTNEVKMKKRTDFLKKN